MPAMNSDQQFESTMSDLCYSVLQDKSPALLDYLLGFQILDVNDEQSKACGVFGAKIGNEYIYLPVFFMNGEIRGMEMMYLKNQDIFVPNTEAWVSYVLNRKPYKLGEKSQITQKDLQGGGADLIPFRMSPENFGKSAATSYKTILTKKSSYVLPVWNESVIQDWAKPFVEASKRNPSADMYKQSEVKLDFVTFMSGLGARGISNVMQQVTKEASVMNSILKFYPVEKITAIKPLDKQADELRDGNRVPDVNIYSYKELNKWDVFNLSDADKKRLLRGELVVKDHRNDTSKVYRAATRQTAQSPNMTGVYDIITETGDLIKCFVIIDPLAIEWDSSANCCTRPQPSLPCSGYSATRVVAINLDGEGRFNGNAEDLFGKPVMANGANSASDLADLSEVSSVSEGKCYSIVNSNGSGTDTFYVVKKTENEDGTISLIICKNLDPSEAELKRVEAGDDFNNYCTINIQPRGYGKINKIGKYIFVPTSAKVVPVSIKPAKEENGYKPYRNSGTYDMPQPGDMETVDMFLWRNNAGVPMKLYSSGQEFQITLGANDSAVKTAGALSYSQALRHLTFNLGIKGETAEAMLKQANARETVKYNIAFAKGYPELFTKKADDPFLSPGRASAPAMDDSLGQSQDPALNVPVQGNVGQSQSIPDLRANSSDYQLYNPNPQLDNNIYDTINSAAQTGQKEVFDTAMIAGLVKATDSNKLIDKYIGDLILGMDRIGRIYFLFLQHNENFEERYGQEDMSELDDSLKNTFKSLGELILFLKQKTVEASPSLDRTKVQLGNKK